MITLPDNYLTSMAGAWFVIAMFVVCAAIVHAQVPSVPLHNAAQEGMTMPLIGIGTGGYGNASGWGGEHWNDTYERDGDGTKWISAIVCDVITLFISVFLFFFPPPIFLISLCAHIPSINSVAEAAVSLFLQAGGRRIDTSLQYYTQIGCGNAWKKSGIPREQIFITSKCDSPLYGMVPGGYDQTVGEQSSS